MDQNLQRVYGVIEHATGVPPQYGELPIWDADKYLVMFSGGKDSLACLLHLLEIGVPRSKIELWHHAIDPHGKPFMDWPCTHAYCQAVADALGVPLLFSGRVGGFEREMLRDNTPTAPVFFQLPDGRIQTTESYEERMARSEARNAEEARRRQEAEAKRAKRDADVDERIVKLTENVKIARDALRNKRMRTDKEKAQAEAKVEKAEKALAEVKKEKEDRMNAAAEKALAAAKAEEFKASQGQRLSEHLTESAARVEMLIAEKSRLSMKKENKNERARLAAAIVEAKSVLSKAQVTLTKWERRQSDDKGTRLKFPQATANLNQRWCSSYLKIDVAARVITNDPRFKEGKFVVITGERAEESAARAHYPIWEEHRSYSDIRRVYQWRAVHPWPETDIWAIIKRWGVVPHPAYYLGFGRVSCMACIFGNPNQWATVRRLNPAMFNKIAGYEEQFGVTINAAHSVTELADGGFKVGAGRVAPPGKVTFPPEMEPLAKISQQEGKRWPLPILVSPGDWKMPAGAFKKDGGPI
jgi:3'-phosphoadenosine 5'-phosphosulfate sulfotransferase (PAPS reductase)/FAD synthetase